MKQVEALLKNIYATLINTGYTIKCTDNSWFWVAPDGVAEMRDSEIGALSAAWLHYRKTAGC